MESASVYILTEIQHHILLNSYSLPYSIYHLSSHHVKSLDILFFRQLNQIYIFDICFIFLWTEIFRTF